MNVPVYSMICFALAFFSLSLGATPGSWWPKLAMVLMLVAGAIPVYESLDKAAAGKDVANIDLGVR